MGTLNRNKNNPQDSREWKFRNRWKSQNIGDISTEWMTVAMNQDSWKSARSYGSTNVVDCDLKKNL